MKNKIKCIIITFAIALMIFGIARGEVKVVLKKATNICRECIGIG